MVLFIWKCRGGGLPGRGGGVGRRGTGRVSAGRGGTKYFFVRGQNSHQERSSSEPVFLSKFCWVPDPCHSEKKAEIRANFQKSS